MAVADGLCEKHLVPASEPKKDEVVVPVQEAAIAVVRAAGLSPVDCEHLEPVDVMAWVVVQSQRIADSHVKLLESGDPKSWVGLARATNEALAYARKAAEAAESAGMQRRRVMIEESKVMTLFLAIDKAIARAEMPSEVDARFRAALGEELAEVTAA